jgi:hypothetical protein
MKNKLQVHFFTKTINLIIVISIIKYTLITLSIFLNIRERISIDLFIYFDKQIIERISIDL